MQKQRARGSKARNARRDRAYDEGVKSAGAGLGDQAELMAPPGVGDELDDQGLPRWDDTERAPPLPPFATAGEDLSVPMAGSADERSRDELRKRAKALGIPGRSRMTKMQLATAVLDAIGRA